MKTLAPESHSTVPPGAVADQYFAAADIALALAVHKKRVLRVARRDAWPQRTDGYRLLLQPPPDIAALIIARPISPSSPIRPIHFADLVHSDPQRELVLRREQAVRLLQENLHLGKEVALVSTAAIIRATYPGFRCQARALREWLKRYQAHGLDGLVDQKRGRVGRKPFAADLDQTDILRARAAAIEFGAARKGDGKPALNIARSYRDTLVANPTITGPARRWLHGANASKSYVPPSVRQALASAPLTATLIQRGPKAAKLDGAWTECDYSEVPAGRAFTADDMTANVYVWTEWPNEQGFILIRPQILAAMDIGSMSWLCLRAVIRPKGQYNHDDVWGLIGDVFDDFGLYPIAVLEGGTWQSKEITGQLCDDEVRFGGLRALGCKVIHTRTPRGKIIETAFNTLQHAADNCVGFCGRNERVDCPETVKQQLAAVRSGKAHPREFFQHISAYKTHLSHVMNSLNHERSDGKILRGLAPADKWAQDNPQNPRFPDSSKWMYRASYRVNEVTRNGVRISTGSGKYQLHYTYSAPELVAHRGRRVAIFWNDYDPDTDAVIYTIRAGKPDQLICVAPRVQSLPRFGATGDQVHAESTRKAALANVARVERASLAPFLQRSAQSSVRPSTLDSRLSADLSAARQEQGRRIRTRKTLRDFQGTAEALLDEAGSSLARNTTQEVTHEVNETDQHTSTSRVVSEDRGPAVPDLDASALLD